MLKETLCWSCKNAVPDMEGKHGCSWSRKFEPVEGWETKVTKRKTKLFAKGTYYYVEDEGIEVVKCPEFIKG